MTADTSVVVAALSAWHEHHELAKRAIAGVRSLPAHALLEAYSVLTRLPGALAVPAGAAAEVLARRFDGPTLRLDDGARAALPSTLAAAGVWGGATYDGVVALEARSASKSLVTLDRRARSTYARLAVDAELLV